MSAENVNPAVPSEETTAPVEGKGKGKEVAEPTAEDDTMDDDDSSSSEDEAEGETAEQDNTAEDDGMEEIDLNNVIEGGRRTRGRVIDFAKAAEENPAQDDDEDDEDDDFQAPEDKMDTN